jgi:hypothetical protein
MRALPADYPSENVFGKMRGRYDEAAARKLAATGLASLTVGLWSLSDYDARELARRFNMEAERCPSQRMRLTFIDEPAGGVQ